MRATALLTKSERLSCAAVREDKAPNCGAEINPLRFHKSPERKPEKLEPGVRLMFENSTVCHSRRISLLCPVLYLPLWGWWGWFLW